HARANMFATVFFGVLDPATGRLWYVNGGHEAPIVLTASGVERTRLTPTGPAVGMMPDMTFGTAEIDLAHGESLLAFTDGALDARSPAGELFGEERLLACAHGSPRDVLRAIQEALAQFSAGEPAYDDVTMLCVRREVTTGG
ncbi:MAG: PP2C family protein-serine/threonine phosphatase, partial [bacterium]